MSQAKEDSTCVRLDREDLASRENPEQKSCWENMPNFGELYVYLVCLLCGISLMMPVNAVFSAPSYMLQYYKYAMNDEFAVPVNTNFWGNVLTYYNVISLVISLVIEPLTLTQMFRRIPMLFRLLSGLCILIIEIILLMVVPAVGTTEVGAIITICFAGLIGGTGKSIFESTVYGMLGAFPHSYMSTMMAGVGISGVLTSLIQIIVKASLPEDFESVKLQSKIYYGLDVGIQGCTFICLILLRFNGVARQYFGDLGGGKSQVRTVKMDMSEVTEEKDALAPYGVPATESEATSDSGAPTSNEILVATDIVPTLKKVMWITIACAFNFAVTLLLFPTIVIMADTTNNYWYATLVVFVFNVMDVLGRYTPTFKIMWPKTDGQRWIIVAASFARVIFVPLLLVYSYHYIKGHAFGYVMMIIFGYSSGYICSMCLVLAPTTKGIVGDGQRFVAATLTGISILVGAVIGSVLSIMVTTIRLNES